MTTTDTGRIVDDVRSQVRSQVERLAALVDYWRDRALTAEAGQPITESGESTIDVHKEVFSPTHPMTPDERAFAEQATARSAESGRRRRPLDPAPPLSCTGLADERVVPDAESSS